MAITLTQVVAPNLYSPVSADIWYGVNSSSSTLNDFKYIFDIWQYNLLTSATTSLGSYRVPPRPTNGYGLISPSKLLKTAMTWTFNPNISAPTPLTTGCVKFGFRYGFTYNPDWVFSNMTDFSSGLPTLAYLINSTGTAWDVATGDVINILMTNQGVNEQFNGEATVIGTTASSGTQYIQINKLYASSIFGAQTGTITSIKRYTGTSGQYYAYQGTRQYNQIATNFTYERVILPDTNFQYPLTNYKNSYAYPNALYSATGSNPYIYANTKSVYANQFETTSILLDPSSTQSIWLRYETYDSKFNTTARKDLNITSYSYPYIRYDLPSGPQNIINAGYISSATMSAAKFYSVGMYDKLSITVGTTSYVSYYTKFVRYFSIDDNCSPYPKNYRLCFMNRQGGTDYWNFNWKNTNVMTQAPTIYRKQLAYNYAVGDRQDTVLSNKANETYVVSTDWISQGDAEFLKELLTSPDAYVYDEAFQQKLPIIILDTQYQQKTAIDNKLFCITLNFRYSYDINLQNN
jgi:hypothetical protein